MARSKVYQLWSLAAASLGLLVACGGSASTDPCGTYVPYTYLGAGYGFGYGYGSSDWYGGGGYYGGWSDPYGGYYGDPDGETYDDGPDDDPTSDDDDDEATDDESADDGVEGSESDGDSASLALLDVSGSRAAASCRAEECTMVCALGSPVTQERSARGVSRHDHRRACDAAVWGLARWASEQHGRLTACREMQGARIPARPTPAPGPT